MKVSVHVKNLDDAGNLKEQVVRSLGFAMDRFEGRLSEIVVSLSDTNGPRGGPDKRCRIRARLATGLVISIEESGIDPIAAVNIGAKRLAYRVGRKLERVQAPQGRVRGVSSNRLIRVEDRQPGLPMREFFSVVPAR